MHYQALLSPSSLAESSFILAHGSRSFTLSEAVREPSLSFISVFNPWMGPGFELQLFLCPHLYWIHGWVACLLPCLRLLMDSVIVLALAYFGHSLMDDAHQWGHCQSRLLVSSKVPGFPPLRDQSALFAFLMVIKLHNDCNIAKLYARCVK